MNIGLPQKWTEASLGEICHRITKGTTPTSIGFEFTSEGILFVKVESLSDKSINPLLCSFISLEADEALSRSQLCENDILFSIAGTLGRVAIVKRQDLPANTNQALSIIRLLPPIYHPYIAEALSSKILDAAIRRDGRGVGIRNLNLKQVSEFSIPLPPLNEQRRIVTKIEELTAHSRRAREALDDVPTLINQFRQSLLAAAFRGDLTADWREKNPDVKPAEELLERIRVERRQRWEKAELEKMGVKVKKPKDDKWKERYKELSSPDTSALPQIPTNWRWSTLPELGELNRGKSKHRPRNDPALYGGLYPFIQTGDVSSADGFIYKFSQTYNETGLQQSRLWPKRTLCITIAANIAETAILGIDACFPDSVVGFLANELSCDVKFVEYFMRTAQNDLERFAPSTAQKNINLEILRVVAIPLPSLGEQEVVVQKLDYHFEIMRRLETALLINKKELNKLDQSILAKAFRGELVPQDPNDEPASALLDRIRAEREKLTTTKKKGRTSRKKTKPDSSEQLNL